MWKKMKRLDVEFLQGWWDMAEGQGDSKMIDPYTTHFAHWHSELSYFDKQGTVDDNGMSHGVVR